jgi:hypothetical protein
MTVATARRKNDTSDARRPRDINPTSSPRGLM